MDELIKKFTEDIRALAPGNRASFLKNLSLAGQSLNSMFLAEKRQYAQDAIDFAESKGEEFSGFKK